MGNIFKKEKKHIYLSETAITKMFQDWIDGKFKEFPKPVVFKGKLIVKPILRN